MQQDKGYKQLVVWQKAFELAILIHRLTKTFSSDERYGYISQMRRSALSIPSNIAEGKGKMSDRELKRYCLIANGSAMELETQLLLAKAIGLSTPEQFRESELKIQEVLRLLNRLIQKLNANG